MNEGGVVPRRFLSATKENLPAGASHAVAVSAPIGHFNQTTLVQHARRVQRGQRNTPPRSLAAHRKRAAGAGSSSRRPGKNIAASSDSLKSPPPAVTYLRMRSSCPSWFFCIRKIIRESAVSRMQLFPCRLSLRLVSILSEERKGML